MIRFTLLAALMLWTAAPLWAQPTIDGSLAGDEAFYGAPLSTQTTRTQFGDNSSDDPIVTASGGSEINQVFGRVDNGRLYVMITGNLETNFNKLEVFFDSVPGGVNTINGAALPASVDGFCCGQTNPNVPAADGALQRIDGLTFDAGFTADRYLTFSNGGENVSKPGEPTVGFWAISAHFADLTQGSSGESQALGVQFAPRGLPQVLRTPIDFNGNGTVDAADYTVWRDSLGATGDGLPADSNGNGVVDQTDYNNWVNNFGVSSLLSGPSFVPTFDFQTTEQQLALNRILPDLAQGQLVDRNYALASGGCTDDEGNGCVARELEFVLDVAPSDPDNANNHRNFNNTIGLELGFDNSNIEGVRGSGGPDFALVPGEDNPEDVLTGIEFSVPLSALGDPTGDIKLLAFINGTGHDFISNQFSGDGFLGNESLAVGRGNPGTAMFSDGPDPPLFTLADIDGDQFVTIPNPAALQVASAAVPEPTTVALLACGGLIAAAGYRRRR